MKRRTSGFTLIEMAVSLSIFSILTVSVFSMATELTSFVTENDVELNVQREGNRAVSRMTDVLRKSGWYSDGTTDYPRVVGNSLEFKVLQDLDGNGYSFDETNGDLEWNSKIYTIKIDASNQLGVFDGSTMVYLLGRHIENLTLETIKENSGLHLKELHVTFDVRQSTGHGYDLMHPLNVSILMRN